MERRKEKRGDEGVVSVYWLLRKKGVSLVDLVEGNKETRVVLGTENSKEHGSYLFSSTQISFDKGENFITSIYYLESGVKRIDVEFIQV